VESMEHGRVIDSNPFVDIATHLFLEDLASKVGVAGLNNYLISLANNLAASMPEEEYESWDEFLDALKNGHSILSSFEDVHAVTKHCMATRRSPFERGWREYAKRVGAFSKVHREVADYYNAKVGGRGAEGRGGRPAALPPEARGDHEDAPRDAPAEQRGRVAPHDGLGQRRRRRPRITVAETLTVASMITIAYGHVSSQSFL